MKGFCKECGKDVAWENRRQFATLPLRRNSILMTRRYPDLGSASDWLCRLWNLLQPIRSTTQIWVVTRHQYGISALVSQTSFAEKLLVASRNVVCFLRLGRMLCFLFLSNMTLKIPSSLNKPVPCSKIVGKTEREKMCESSNYDWLVIISTVSATWPIILTFYLVNSLRQRPASSF